MTTTNWLNNRSTSQLMRTHAHAFGSGEQTLTYVGRVAKELRVPFWAGFATVIITATAVCGTVISSARGQLTSASNQYQTLTAKVSSLQHENQRLETEIQRVNTDSTTIEAIARERLGMVRPTDVVIPLNRTP